tara:strand:- start:7 stop:171 length:165 start_codon:yes stop_codon:yes gene_type:complete
MNTLGYTTMKALAHVTLGIVLGLFIVLPIHLMAVNILAGSTFGSLEHLKEKNAK